MGKVDLQKLILEVLEEESLNKWFSRQGGSGSSSGWVDCNTCRKDKKTGRKKCKSCGRQKGEKRAKYPSCRPTASACGQKGKGKTWGKTKNETANPQDGKAAPYGSGFAPITREELTELVREVLAEKKADRCLRIARRKYDKPSAYRSGAIVRCRKGDIWKGLKEGEEASCPTATQDLELNTKNRDASIKADHIKYGPLNVDEPGTYWKDIAKHWDTTEEAAKKSLCGNCVAFDISPRMDECMPGVTSDDDGRLGYCWMHHFKCHSARSCKTWAKGGPITEDSVSLEWQERNEKSIEEGPHDPVKPGRLKKRYGKLSCTKMRKEKSALKDKGTDNAKAIQRYLNYHCKKK